MAKGRNCPVCGRSMAVKSERRQPMGSDVVYECRNTACRNYISTDGRYPFRERVFEDK